MGARPMSARASAATAARVLSQLRHDLRTVALLLVVPCVLLTLLKYLFEAQPQTFDRIGVPLVGLFPLLQMFIVTSVTMLRERTSGTLERLMASPLAKLDLLAGYAAAFALVGIAQAGLVATYADWARPRHVGKRARRRRASGRQRPARHGARAARQRPFARSEFQATQFMPAFILPQLLLCGLFVLRERMAGALEMLADALPATYTYDALDRL